MSSPRERQVIRKEDVGTLSAGPSVPPTSPPENEKAEKSGLKFEIYQRADGWWSFRVNGEESHYRSSNQEGLGRTMKALLFGLVPGTIKLRPVRAKAHRVGDATELEQDTSVGWTDLPTQKERLEAFLKRGKLNG